MDEARKVTKYLDSFTGSNMYEDGLILIDADGCSLSQVLYYIDKGIPVIAYVETGQYVLLSGYDATEYFNNLQNDFLCALSVN